MCPALQAIARFLGPAAACAASVAQDAVAGPAVHEHITVADVAQWASHTCGVDRQLASDSDGQRLGCTDYMHS